MRQLARRLRDGSLELIEVPDPSPGPGAVSVRVEASIVSSGTERATLEVARSNLLAKARARPEQARAVLERARKEGVRSTAKLVRQRLESLGPLGYSAAGVALEVGERVRGIAAGDKVAIGGGGFANHAEVDVVPSLLCVAIPEGVSSEDAAFATLGAIAMNGFRRGEATVGATVAVVGLGLIGQLSVRIARAAGCRVLGVDLDPDLCGLARLAGADAVPRAELGEDSRWHDVADAVLVCASSESSDPVTLGAELARDRAPVVVVGAVGMDIPRAPFYDKELDLRLSRSYGPGRYDPDYELHGIDYPIGHVRWTEQRNMAAFLDLVAAGAVRPAELVSHRFAFDEAEDAFEALRTERPVAIALSYPKPERPPADTRPATPRAAVPRSSATPRFGILGAGNFATATLIPGLIRAGFGAGAIASASGLSAADAGQRFGFDVIASGPDRLIEDESLDLIVVATRHDSHAELAARALAAGRPVYVEKPLALDHEGLRAVRDAQAASGAPLFVGFNRRFAPLAERTRELGGPRMLAYRVNAGPLPRDHWANDLERGGGRLKGEGCHFIDFVCDQVGADPVEVQARGFPSRPDLPIAATDNFSVQIGFDDRSVASVHYAADAPTGPGKERYELSAPGLYAVVEDFVSGTIWRGGKRRKHGGGRQDKGFEAQFAHLAAVCEGKVAAPEPDSFLVSTLATLAAARSLETGDTVPIVQARAGGRSVRDTDRIDP